MSEPATQLSTTERSRLAELEDVIDQATRGVTENGSAHVGEAVLCNDCWNGERYGFTTRRVGRELHCSTCHGDDHWACESCGTCLPRSSRGDRRYCSSTCRARGRKERERAAMERAAWLAENPEAAAKEQAERQASLEKLREIEAQLGGSPEKRDHRRRLRELVARADRCAKCERPFAAGDIIYRRRAKSYGEVHAGCSLPFEGNPTEVALPVQPYCTGCRCTQPDGFHNRDAPEGRYYPACRCDDAYGTRRYWAKPEPCIGCGRLVSHPSDAGWRPWHYHGEGSLRLPRVFCGSECKRRVLAVEAKSRRLAAAAQREPCRCVVCKREFSARRPDVRYCSSACRQRAYRKRKRET